jgi:hypothetical protein
LWFKAIAVTPQKGKSWQRQTLAKGIGDDEIHDHLDRAPAGIAGGL